MKQIDFWKDVTEILASHAKYHGTQEDWQAHREAELDAYASHWQKIRATLDSWIDQIRRRGFEVTLYDIDSDRLHLLYTKRGYHGVAGLRAVLDAAGNFVVSWIPKGTNGIDTITSPDTEEATHLGRRYSPDKLQGFLESDLLTLIDESNLCLPSDARKKWLVDYLERFRAQFDQLARMKDRQSAGRQFEDFLNRLFILDGLDPRGSFRMKGGQIDGSFILDSHTYLVEAKWVKGKIGPEPLGHFQSKMKRKSTDARGVFISVNGVTASAAESVRQGDTPRFFIITGPEIQSIIEGSGQISDLLRKRQRQFDEEGEILAKPG